MISILFSLLLLTPAHAKVKGFCKPLKELQAEVLSCDENDHYLDAAIDCLEGLEKDSAKDANALGLAIFSGGAQAKSFSDGSLNFAQAKGVLAALLLEAQTRKVEIENYGRNVNFPEDFDNPEIVKGEPDKFLAGSECYHRAGTVMESVLQEMEKHIGQIEKAQAEVNKAAAKLKGDASALGSENTAAHGKGKGTATVPSGTEKKSGSDITGTEQEKP
ncbi:MAG: hypothetical protein ACXVB9_09400 [Bdellovibrionota bacterium]